MRYGSMLTQGSAKQYKGIFDCVQTIMKEEGPHALLKVCTVFSFHCHITPPPFSDHSYSYSSLGRMGKVFLKSQLKLTSFLEKVDKLQIMPHMRLDHTSLVWGTLLWLGAFVLC